MGSTLNDRTSSESASISDQYFAAFPKLPNLRLVAVADLDVARAASVADAQGVERAERRRRSSPTRASTPS